MIGFALLSDVSVLQQMYVCLESSHESCHESAWLYRPLVDDALLGIASKSVIAFFEMNSQDIQNGVSECKD